METVEAYNYKNFKAEHYQLDNFPGPKTGEQYIDIDFTDVDGNNVKLSDYLDKPIVLESGSITCPMYSRCVKDMNAIMKAYPDINFLLAYVREAHPGERLGPHKTMAEKNKQAKRLQRIYGEYRTILVDDLEGNFHKHYGMLPNFIYVIDTDGTVLFRGDWNNIDVIKKVLTTIKDKKIHKEAHIKPSGFWQPLTLKTLWQGGIKSFWDILLTMRKLHAAHKVAGEKYDEAEKINN